jgi:hypothetical protein
VAYAEPQLILHPLLSDTAKFTLMPIHETSLRNPMMPFFYAFVPATSDYRWTAA